MPLWYLQTEGKPRAWLENPVEHDSYLTYRRKQLMTLYELPSGQAPTLRSHLHHPICRELTKIADAESLKSEDKTQS
uniref:Uncharacterized protein n=1 Tax=Leersia perrieri TaxID=77586 RepID=A0A0D9X9G1_9ORYZ